MKRWPATQRSTAATSRPVRVDDAAGDVGEPDDHRAARRELARDHGADVAESLDRDALPGELPAEVLEQPLGAEDGAEAGRLAPAGGPAEHDGLAGDDLGRRMADLLGVGVHEPGHLALARGHVGRGDVAVGADDREELRRVAARQALELLRRKAVRVTADAALGAAERQARSART